MAKSVRKVEEPNYTSNTHVQNIRCRSTSKTHVPNTRGRTEGLKVQKQTGKANAEVQRQTPMTDNQTQKSKTKTHTATNHSGQDKGTNVPLYEHWPGNH